MLYLLFLAMLLSVAIAESSNITQFNDFGLLSRAAPDIVLTAPDYTNPGPLNMPNDDRPTFRSGWEPCDTDKRIRAQKAFFDATVLAKGACDYIKDFSEGRNDGFSFTRYFHKLNRVQAESVMKATFFNVGRLAGAVPAGTAPARPVWNPRLKYLDVHFGPFPLGVNNGKFDMYCRIPGDYAVLVNGDRFAKGMPPERALIVLCQRAFDWPDLPASDDKSRCSAFASTSWQTYAQESLPNTIFHELLHNTALHDKQADTKATADYPSDGYGPWNAFRLNLAGGLDGRNWQPLFNADSYMLFANELWWSKHCAITLVDPPNEDATQLGWIPYASGPVVPDPSDTDGNA